ncbi:MAG: imidazole glycerol phosphate synthase subunit HisH [Ignavibacteriae bacterium]|nr:imidazole glycerol phosphate synthase subunit HisH [Ignavibacteriota bacterium]
MIGIIDYGLGNIKAFANVYKNLDLDYQIIKNSEDLIKVSKIILPGVGSFDHAMNLLNNSGMRNTLDNLVLKEKIPVLGICVGLQILANGSEEGNLPGLGWIDAEVKKFDASTIPYKTRLPHMGWNIVEAQSDNYLLSSLNEKPRFYFLHSYYFKCNNSSDSISQTNYGSYFTSAVNKENIYGVQFHPEKSHHNGIQVLKNFAEL